MKIPIRNTVGKRVRFEHGTAIESQKVRNQVNNSMDFQRLRLLIVSDRNTRTEKLLDLFIFLKSLTCI